jgi:argininosuccinate lyase
MGLWGGVFNEPTDDDLRRLNDSLPFDQRLYREDIAGSIAYAHAIAAAGVITHQEAADIAAGLQQILAEFDAGSFAFREGDEDIHTAVERRLVEIAGAVGGKLHTGRSRNDQVATDFRLWCLAACGALAVRLRQLQRAIIGLAETHVDTLMAGYTHMQPAQPLTVAHWILSYFWMLERDVERLEQARQRMNCSPLGAGALAGTPLPLDRHALSAALGFREPMANSLDAVSDRDFVADVLFVASLLAVHLSRLAEDIILFSNPAFGYFTLHDRYSTGSSLMPQKRNADPMELTRGKAGRLIGNLSGLLTTMKGLPTGYNKDMQEDKEALFDSLDTLAALLPVVTGVVATLRVHPEALRRALTEEMLATDLADYLVARGLPFREAHHVVGRVVRWALEAQVPLSRVPLDVLHAQSVLFDRDVYSIFDFAQSVAKRRAYGGTAPAAVREQIAQAKARLGV